MRQEFFKGSRYMAKKQNTWACKITKVVGGFICFESIADYNTWRNQK